MSIETRLDTQELANVPLKAHYEAVLRETLAMLWRHKWLILPLIAASLAYSLYDIATSYSSRATIQLDFSRMIINETPDAVQTPASVESRSVVENEARFISSRALAKKVAQSQGLEDDPRYGGHQGLVSTIITGLRAIFTDVPASPSKTDLAVNGLLKRLNVFNDSTSHVITIEYNEGEPQKAARIANAFAAEYIRDRITRDLTAAEIAARHKLQKLSVLYGRHHHQIALARADVKAAKARMEEAAKATDALSVVNDSPGRLVTLAQPEPSPANTASVIMSLFFAGMGALIVGAGAAFLLDRRDSGFATEREIIAHTGLRSLGLIPAIPNLPKGKRPTAAVSESLRALALSSDLIGNSTKPTTMLVTCALPDEGHDKLALTLADQIARKDRRILVVDLAGTNSLGNELALNAIITDAAERRRYFETRQSENVVDIALGSPAERARLVATPEFEHFIEQGAKLFDIVILVGPPVLLSADARYLASMCDTCIHTARWNKTPRRAVTAALRDLRDANAPLRGIALIGVDTAAVQQYDTGDRLYYLKKYQKLEDGAALDRRVGALLLGPKDQKNASCWTAYM